MEKFITYIFSLGFVLIISGCKGQDSSLPISNPSSNVSVITFDVYKEGVDNGLSMIYLSESASVLIKSNGIESLDFQEVPPPPPNQLGGDMVDSNVQDIKAEVIHLGESTTKEIESLITNFSPKDLSSLINPRKTGNGVGIKVIMTYSNNDTKDFTLINGATENQRKLLRYVFDKAIEKSEYNNKQLKIFLR